MSIHAAPIPPQNTANATPLRLGIAGLGTVGMGVIRLIRDHATLLTERTGKNLSIVAISARNRQRDRGIDLASLNWHDDAVSLAHDPNVDVVIELIGGAEGTARALVEAALQAGKPVVTANKALIALHGQHLAQLSRHHQTALLFEAAVAGGIPAIKLVREGIAADNLHYVGGILNGTCNYILSEMAKSGRDFDIVLKEAQEKGYAEAEPSTDVDGWDTAHKLAILAGIAFQPITFQSLKVDGIRHITAADLKFTKKLGYCIKLLGMVRRAENHGIEAWVRPCLIPTHAALAHVHDVFNALTMNGPFSGPLTISGRGAGEGPTASAVVADLVDLGRGHYLPLWGRDTVEESISCASLAYHETAFYLRLIVDDHSGVMADISSVLRDQNVSVHLISQHDAPQDTSSAKRAFLTVITHPVATTEIEHAVKHLAALPCVHGTPLSLTIEKLP